jgi:hypothetical protein
MTPPPMTITRIAAGEAYLDTSAVGLSHREPSMKTKTVAASFSLLLSLLAFLVPRTAHAFCGFYVSGADTKLFNNATQVVLMRDGMRTVLSMQNNYEGPPENFALVVPVPVVLQKENVKTLSKDIFTRLDQLDAPRLVEYWEQDPCAPGSRYDIRTVSAGAPMPSPVSAMRARGDLGVTVEAQFTVGEYEVVILSAKDATGLESWLNEEHYKIPEGAAPYFKPYIESGSKFFVAKVDTTKVKFENGMASLSPLRFFYDSEKFSLPVRLGLMNAKGTQDLIVHVLAKKQRYELANYDNVTIPTNFDVAESARGEFGTFYTALFDRTKEKNPKAVITEYSWDAATCDPCPVPALTPQELTTLGDDVISQMNNGDAGVLASPQTQAPGGPVGPGRFRRPGMGRGFWSSWVITRLHARYTKESLGEDLVFRTAEPITGGREVMAAGGALEHGSVKGATNNFQARYVIRHPWTGAIECKEPHRGVWGGPPVRRDAGLDLSTTEAPKPMAAQNLAFAKRDPSKLASYVRSGIPELGIEGSPAGTLPPETRATDVPPTPAPKKDCGCSLVGSTSLDSGALSVFALLALALVARLRSRRTR